MRNALMINPAVTASVYEDGAFSPLFPSCRSLLEPIRTSNPFATYLEASCEKIEPDKKVRPIACGCDYTTALVITPGGCSLLCCAVLVMLSLVLASRKQGDKQEHAFLTGQNLQTL